MRRGQLAHSLRLESKNDPCGHGFELSERLESEIKQNNMKGEILISINYFWALISFKIRGFSILDNVNYRRTEHKMKLIFRFFKNEVR